MPDHVDSVKSVATYMRGWAERNKEKPEIFARMSDMVAALSDAADEMSRLLALTKALPSDLGNIYDLPADLREELSVSKTDETEDQIVTAINAFGGSASLDQILVGIYRKFGVVQKRRFVQGKLYRMDMIWPVDGRKGIYTTTKPDDAVQQAVEILGHDENEKGISSSSIDFDDEIPF